MKKDEAKEILEIVNFIKDKMATSDELAAVQQELGDRIAGVESKVSGVNRRLDTEAMARQDQKLPARVSDLEKEVFGQSRAPKHSAL